jgi:hypothetical protein
MFLDADGGSLYSRRRGLRTGTQVIDQELRCDVYRTVSSAPVGPFNGLRGEPCRSRPIVDNTAFRARFYWAFGGDLYDRGTAGLRCLGLA